MRKTEVSLRQLLALSAAGLLAPAADLLPGLLADRAGAGAWTVPLVMLPVVLLWGWGMERLFRAEGSDLFSLLWEGGWLKIGLAFLYIIWCILLLAEQVGRSAARVDAVYGGRGGGVAAAWILALVVWMLWKKGNGIWRSGELLWLGVALSAGFFILMGFTQAEWRNLLPRKEEWRGQPAGWLSYCNMWGSLVLAGALAGNLPRKGGALRRIAGWMTGISFGIAALIGAVLGQTGAGLAGRLSQPFLIAIQGLSLEGMLARLEAPAATLWLMADFCREALFLAALQKAGGERWGNRLLFPGAVLALIVGERAAVLPGMEFAGLVLGFLVPGGLWLGRRKKGHSEKESISCGKKSENPHRYGKNEKGEEKGKKT